MKLIKCPKCGDIINISSEEEVPTDIIIGCGWEEDDFISCRECGENYDSQDCKSIRSTYRFTLTSAGDMFAE